MYSPRAQPEGIHRTARDIHCTPVSIHTAPVITDQPTNQTDIAMCLDATFTVVAAGENLTYQWQYGGVDIMDITDMYSGTNTADLTVITVDASDEGAYVCNVSNENGAVTTALAFLSVGKL